MPFRQSPEKDGNYNMRSEKTVSTMKGNRIGYQQNGTSYPVKK